MASKTFSTYDINSSITVLETPQNKKRCLLDFYIKQLENAIYEANNSVSFKTNLLKWAIKADNLTMALNQSQFIILKSNEIEMLNTVYAIITSWAKNLQNANQEQYVTKVVGLLKTALMLIEDVPSSASYDAFKRFVEVLDNMEEESDNIFQLKAIRESEKMNLVKKSIKEICNESTIPKRMLQLAFKDSFQTSTCVDSVCQASDTVNDCSTIHDRLDSTMSHDSKVLPLIKNPSVPVVSKDLSPQLMSNGLLQKDDRKPAKKPRVRVQNEGNLCAGRRSFDQLDKKSVMVEPDAQVSKDEAQNMRNAALCVSRMRGNFFSRNTSDLFNATVGHFTSGTRRRPLLSPYVALDKEENAIDEITSNREVKTHNVTPIIPWYYQRLTQANLCHQCEPDTQEPIKSLAHGTEVDAVHDVLIMKKSVCMHCIKRSCSPDSSLNSILSDNQEVPAKGQLCSSPLISLHCSPSTSTTSYEAPEIEDQGVKFHQQSTPTSPVAASEPHFPALSLIPQLCQQKSEPTGAWIDRLGGQLKKYLRPSSYEYDIIIRWILSCGSIHKVDFPTASVGMSAEQIAARLIGNDGYNDSKSGSAGSIGIEQDSTGFHGKDGPFGL